MFPFWQVFFFFAQLLQSVIKECWEVQQKQATSLGNNNLAFESSCEYILQGPVSIFDYEEITDVYLAQIPFCWSIIPSDLRGREWINSVLLEKYQTGEE